MPNNDVPQVEDKGVALNPSHPWPGLVSFTEANKSFFFGRDREVAELLRLVRQERLTVFFGKSGLGKSSILRAGLSPKLRQLDFIPIYVRLHHVEEAAPLVEQVKSAIQAVRAAEKIDAPNWEPGETLWEYFHKKSNGWWDVENRLIKPVLIIDQFEELLTLGQETAERSARTAQFLTELEDLVENRPPAALTARFRENKDLADEYDHRRFDYRVILTLREDFLPDLEGLRERLSPVMTNRLRLLPMNGEEAMAVVLRPNPDLVDEDVAVQIIDFVSSSSRSRLGSGANRSQVARNSIEPALLCVVLQELNRRRISNGQEKLTAELVGQTDPTEIFHEFYLRGLEGMSDEVRDFIETSLLTSSGARNRIAEEDALTRPAITARIIRLLIDRRIIQRETSGGVKWLELTHDTLADVVRTERATHSQQREIARAAAHEAEALRKLRGARQLAGIFGLLFLAALAALIYGINEKRAALSAQKAVLKTTDELVNGIERQINESQRIRTPEKLILAKQLVDSLTTLQQLGKSDDLSLRLAGLLANMSYVLFQAGRLDEASNYANTAQDLVAKHPGITQKDPLVAANVQISLALAELDTGDALHSLTTLTEAEKLLQQAPPNHPAALAVTKARIASVRTEALSYDCRYPEADVAAAAGIISTEASLHSADVADDKSAQRSIAGELLELRFDRGVCVTRENQADKMAKIQEEYSQTLRSMKDRFQKEDVDWTYYEARELMLKGSAAQLKGALDTASDAERNGIEKFTQLLNDDPQNIFWRFQLANALVTRADLISAENSDQTKLDLENARRLEATILRDQANPFLGFRLGYVTDSVEASQQASGRTLARLSFDPQPSTSLRRARNTYVAHWDDLSKDVLAEDYPRLMSDTDAALKSYDEFTSATKVDPQTIATNRIDILETVLSVDADKLGREAWLKYYDVTEKELEKYSTFGTSTSDYINRYCFVHGCRAGLFASDGKDRDALAIYGRITAMALDAGKSESDSQKNEVDSYLIYQRDAMEENAAIDAWDAALKISQDTRAEFIPLLAANPKLAALSSHIKNFVTLITQIQVQLQKDAAGKPADPRLNIWATESAAYTAQAAAMEQAFKQDSENKFTTANRVDLKQFDLGDWRTGAKEELYWLVKQPLGWTDAPVFPAIWHTLVGDEFNAAATQLTATSKVPANQILQIRECPLSFYDQGKLFEAEVVDDRGYRETISIFTTPKGAYQLDGTSPPIHLANSQTTLHLDTAEQAASYLRFFSSYVNGEAGAFQVVESSRDLPWAAFASSQMKEDVGRLLRPLAIWPAHDGKGSWGATATIQYGADLSHVILKIPASGVVEMQNDNKVASNLPINPPRVVKGMRHEGKLEMIDLASVNPPPPGDDEANGMLELSKSMPDREHAMQLVREAASLVQASGQTPGADLNDFARTIGWASNLLGGEKNDEEAVRILKEAADTIATEYQAKSTDKVHEDRRYDYLLALSYLAEREITAKKYSDALNTIARGDDVRPSSYLFLEAYRAHALMFDGKTTEAEALYQKYVGKPMSADDSGLWQQSILADFDAYDKDGKHDPEMDRIRKLWAPADGNQAPAPSKSN